MIALRNIVFYLLFVLGSIVCISMGALTSPLGREHTQRWPDRWSRWHRWLCENILAIRVVVEGPQETRPVLYALRHESFFEAIDLPVLLDKPVPFAKAELFRIPGWRAASRGYGAVEVKRDQGATMLRQMVSQAKGYSAEGRPLCIFPEGTRVPHGEERALQSGFAGLYKLLRLPVVPVAVDSGPLYHRFWKRPGTITVRFHEQIEPGLQREEIEERVRTAINSLN
ncbi:lysophospholipid acyltransferase family protein [Alteriqipengyuania flavescens]|uniref:lysophospholipid acyltransferase family protein n=1 Tax=Alteriqipengyuania flavescens TaxID=3053610 RepID=UPI0025B56DA1|nr:lysophospholipid acyltransferase family protein [Alteriqipengyuania flavescens]WJY19284.1 lysophospholipid acyltransferase family protein [Alteriqipengyuania flavescens]WJY25225.1 lysophospholipid acyltransferase family protein [Alteriqipengyuania flavescens]